jgi:hypothetical protein
MSEKNSLPILRILYYSILFYIVQQSEFFESWARMPSEFWHPNGPLSYFNTHFVNTEMMVNIVLLWKISLIFSALGLLYHFFAPLSLFIGFFCANYSHSFGYQGHVYMPCILMGLPLAFSYASRQLSIDKFLFKNSDSDDKSHQIVIFNMQLIFCIVFSMAGLSKLVNSGSDWILSDTLRNYILRGQILFMDTNSSLEKFSAFGIYLYNNPYLCNVLAGLTIFLEIGVLTLLFSKRFFYFLIPALVTMQIAIYFTIGVSFKPYILMYLCWLPYIFSNYSIKNKGILPKDSLQK